MKPQHQLTSDGSSTLFSGRFNETYHSRHGAIQESVHVFIKAGWEHLASKPTELHIFEMGFGTGLNALLAAMKAASEEEIVHYTSLEAYPIGQEEIETLNYGNMLDEQALFEALHAAPWNKKTAINPFFSLQKLQLKLEDFDLESGKYNLVFFDAFAPNSQPELWTEAVFKKMYKLMTPGGILTTYCAKGDVRRAMIAAGLSAERIPGPPGKREMLRARRTVNSEVEAEC
jgi:tRNA U34 5-methylaminomethyl-2-thiouridine-forming methyltransferase MnmC